MNAHFRNPFVHRLAVTEVAVLSRPNTVSYAGTAHLVFQCREPSIKFIRAVIRCSCGPAYPIRYRNAIMAKSLPTAWEALKWRGTSAFGFHGKRHPGGLNAGDVEAFLSHLAVKGQVAASTQNQALAALLFL